MSDSRTLVLSNRTYDILKWLTQIALPALATLYFALSEIWGFPNGAEVVGTIAALTAFLGVTLGVNTKQYNKSDAKYDGVVQVVETEDTKSFNLEFDGDPYDLDQKGELVFRVEKENA